MLVTNVISTVYTFIVVLFTLIALVQLNEYFEYTGTIRNLFIWFLIFGLLKVLGCYISYRFLEQLKWELG